MTRRREPIQAGERLVFMDGLRGLALMGIFLINIGGMSAPSMAYGMDALWDGSINYGISVLRHWLGDGAFFFLFAMLFGAGFSMMMGGVRLSFGAYYRRLLLIGGFGFLHVALLWWGDVLMAYALVGAFLPLFRERRLRTQMIWAGLLIAGPTLLFAGLLLLPEMVMDVSGDWAAAYQAELAEWIAYLLEGYRSGDSGIVAEARWAEFNYNFSLFVFTLPTALGYMLIGQMLAQHGRFLLDTAQDAFFRKLLCLVLLPAVFGKLVYVCAVFGSPTSANYVSFMFGFMVGGPALGLVYFCALRRLFFSSAGRRFREGLVAAGRMALTNYLLQSAFAGLLFYGYGFGLYGRVGPAGQVVIVLAFFALQMWGSMQWLRRFRMGPLEWLLRRWTYL